MDQKAMEALAIFCNAAIKLEERRKGILEIKKKAEEDINECRKRIEEVKLKKKKVPLYSPNSQSLSIVQEKPTKEIRRRGRRKAAEKAIEKNAACSRITLKTKLRKRTSDDELLEEQPLSKIRKEVNTTKAVQNDALKKTFKEVKATIEEKEVTSSLINGLDEKEKNNSVQNETKNINLTVINTVISDHNEVKEDEKSINEINNVPEINKNLHNFDGNDGNNKIVSSEIDKSNKIIIGNDKSECCSNVTKKGTSVINNKTTFLTAYPNNSIIEKTNSFLSNNKHSIKNISFKNSEIMKSVIKMGSSEDVNSDVNKEDKTIEGDQNNDNSESDVANRTLKNIEILSSEEKVECGDEELFGPINKSKNNYSGKSAVTKDNFAVLPDASVHATRVLSAHLSSDEELPEEKTVMRLNVPKVKDKKASPTASETASTCFEGTPVLPSRVTRSKMVRKKDQLKPNSGPSVPTEESAPVVEIRMTRSKMAKPKKDNTDANCRSGEESDARNEFSSSSDGEMGKKKVKDIVKMINDRQAMVLLSPVKLTKEQEKENQHVGLLRLMEKKEKRTPSIDRKCVVTKTTPLQVRNGIITPNKKPMPVINSATRNKTALDDAEKRKKEEEARRKREKEEEVLRKKQERLKLKQEELKKRCEEKRLKAAAMREAAEKEKIEFMLKQEKEREEKEKLAKAEIERKKMEEAHKKRLANQTKAAEVETRRLKEEAARLARLKEMEEEQRLQEELRQKQIEENEKNLKIRQEEHRAKEKEALKMKILYQKELLKKKKAIIKPLKDKDNYSITADLAADDDDDEEDEESSKKEYPAWAKKEERLMQSKVQVHCPMDLVMEFFSFPSTTPDLTDIFGKLALKRMRSSSAVWLDSPPLKVYQQLNN